jgi:hypothetical protein
VRWLAASCGTILAYSDEGLAWDVVARQPLDPDMLGVVCDAQRQKVFGSTRTGEDIVTQSGAIVEHAPSRIGVGNYAISPKGNMFAVGKALMVCVRSLPSSGQSDDVCHPSEDAGYRSRVSVDDAGRVLFVTGDGRTCYYIGQFGSEKPLAGADRDECIAISMWASGSSPRVVVRLGDMPQWVPRATADELLSALEKIRASR